MNDSRLMVYRSYLSLLAGQQLRAFQLTHIETEDVVQETFRRALQAREHFRGEDSKELAAWLRIILMNILRDTLRKERRSLDEQKLEQDLEMSSIRLDRWLECDELTPRRKMLRQEAFLTLADALVQLPNDQRTAVELRYLEGRTIREITEIMDRSAASIGGLLQRGLMTLRETFKSP